MKILTHLSLFSGVGGLDIAAEMAGFVTVGQCEWADAPTKVLQEHWPHVPMWKDIRTLTEQSLRDGLEVMPSEAMPTTDITVISGGFP